MKLSAKVEELTACQTKLDDELNEVAGGLNVLHARLVETAVRYLADNRLWAGAGLRSLAHWLSWRLGITIARARQVVTIAERAAELPECMAAFRDGLLSIDQMAAVAKHAPWWTDAQVCRLAQSANVNQLTRALRNYRFPDIPPPNTDEPGTDETEQAADDTSPEAATRPGEAVTADDQQPEQPQPDEWCRFGFDDSGRFWLSLETDTHSGKLIEAALTEARDQLFRNGQPGVNWIDAAREIAHRSLDTIDSDTRRDRYRINYHLDATGGAVDSTGARLPACVRRHITCDGLLSPVFTENGLPTSVGRSQHIVPGRTRRQILLRDHGCRVPGCTETHWLEVHHIIHWEDDGPTDTWNLISLCPHHHRLHHQGRLGITGNADQSDGIAFTSNHGDVITDSGARPKPGQQRHDLSPPIGTYHPPEGGRLESRWLYFNPPLEHRQRATAA